MLSKEQRATILSDALRIEEATNKWLLEDPSKIDPSHFQKYDEKWSYLRILEKTSPWQIALKEAKKNESANKMLVIARSAK